LAERISGRRTPTGGNRPRLSRFSCARTAADLGPARRGPGGGVGRRAAPESSKLRRCGAWLSKIEGEPCEWPEPVRPGPRKVSQPARRARRVKGAALRQRPCGPALTGRP
jgi:hypothetical protein